MKKKIVKKFIGYNYIAKKRLLMKKILIIFIVIFSSFSSYAWIDSVYWNRAVLPHTLRTIGQFDQGTNIKYVDQYFLNGGDTLILDLVFAKCDGPASIKDWDSTMVVPTSITNPFYCILLRVIIDSNTVLLNCFVLNRYIDTLLKDCNAPLSIPEGNNRINGIQIFPNPVREKLNIDIGKEKANTICIYNLFGKLIRKEKYQHGLDVSELPSGTYLVAMQTDKEVEWRKFLKE